MLRLKPLPGSPDTRNNCCWPCLEKHQTSLKLDRDPCDMVATCSDRVDMFFMPGSNVVLHMAYSPKARVLIVLPQPPPTNRALWKTASSELPPVFQSFTDRISRTRGKP